MKFTVVGAGGIGGLVGAWMTRAGYDVTFVEQWTEHADAIAQRGLHIDGARGVHHIPARAITPDQLERLAPLEMVIVAVKSQDTESALRQLLPYSTDHTTFVSMQAGFNALMFEAVVGRERIIVGNPHFGGALTGAGQLEAGFPNYIWIGEWDGAFTPRLRELQIALNTWTPTYLSADIWGVVWSKFCFGFQTICSSISDRRSGQEFAEERYQRVAAGLVGEAIRIADALGIDLIGLDFFDPTPYRLDDTGDPSGLALWINCAWPRHEVFRAHGFHTFRKTGSGMRFDMQVRNRKSESTARLPALRLLSQQTGLITPLIDHLMSMVAEIESGQRKPTQLNLDELYEFMMHLKGLEPEIC
jgi:2-dehydropantoate 2-reductase